MWFMKVFSPSRREVGEAVYFLIFVFVKEISKLKPVL